MTHKGLLIQLLLSIIWTTQAAENVRLNYSFESSELDSIITYDRLLIEIGIGNHTELYKPSAASKIGQLLFDIPPDKLEGAKAFLRLELNPIIFRYTLPTPQENGSHLNWTFEFRITNIKLDFSGCTELTKVLENSTRGLKGWLTMESTDHSVLLPIVVKNDMAGHSQSISLPPGEYKMSVALHYQPSPTKAVNYKYSKILTLSELKSSSIQAAITDENIVGENSTIDTSQNELEIQKLRTQPMGKSK